MNSSGSRAAQSGICAVPIMSGYAKRESVWRVEFRTKEGNKLPLGELEALAGALLTVLLPFMCASIARQKSELLQFAAQFGIKFNQSAGNPEARRPSLSGHPATMREDQNIESFRCLGCKQWLPHIGASRFVHKVMVKRTSIDSDLTFPRPQKHARGCRLAAAGS
jgi:hypothetical protein